MTEGQLHRENVDIDVPAWNAEGDGEHSSALRITELRPIVSGGATLLGSFFDGQFAGSAVHPTLFAEEPEDIHFICPLT